MKQKILVLSLILTLGFLLIPASHAKGVYRIVVIKTDNISAYMNKMHVAAKMLKRFESPAKLSVMRAAYAGENVGEIIVSLRYPSMLDLAKDEKKFIADREYRSWLASLKSIRTVVSDSIYRDISP